VATLFPNEASLLRLVTAIVSEDSEEWGTATREDRFGAVLAIAHHRVRSGSGGGLR